MSFRLFRGNPGKSVAEEKRELEEEKRELEFQLTNQAKALSKAEIRINELRGAYESAEFRVREASKENTSMAKQHASSLTALTIEHSKSMSESEEKYNRTITSLKQENTARVQKLETDYGKEINKLVGQLLVNQDDNHGWPDDKLKLKFRELQQLIELVTSPSNKEFSIPPNQQLGPHLDPTNFLGRVGRGKSHFMLSSIIWNILREQFFSAPFGFGALGPDKGRRELLNFHSAWRKLFDEHTGIVSPETNHLAIFQQDKLVNKWRSASFQCINVALAASNESNPASLGLVAKLSADNLRETVHRIMGVLTEVSRLSNSHVRSEMENEIRHIANVAREIALQFGVNLAQLQLFSPHRGEQIQIGEEFHDCEDGDCYRGTLYVVDLAVVPGILKIGDSRSDMTTKRVVVPCEIYPEVPPS